MCVINEWTIQEQIHTGIHGLWVQLQKQENIETPTWKVTWLCVKKMGSTVGQWLNLYLQFDRCTILARSPNTTKPPFFHWQKLGRQNPLPKERMTQKGHVKHLYSGQDGNVNSFHGVPHYQLPSLIWNTWQWSMKYIFKRRVKLTSEFQIKKKEESVTDISMNQQPQEL